VPFAYYQHLTSAQKAIYRKSARISQIPLERPHAARPLVDELRAGLARDDRIAVQEAANQLGLALTQDLGIIPVRVEVLAVRPRRRADELHGLYTWEEGRQPHVQVWMRTAQHQRVVAFRTFLRTLLHEMCHHVDYHLFGLSESYHTEGFFRRESSLVRQLSR
jgi:hypothetical protein